ncbi:hypothetical protein TNCV_64261 [Trichonephila clavipes]|nr:hypothetical protein TNCV_64261 [Trichonephila clavipes]
MRQILSGGTKIAQCPQMCFPVFRTNSIQPSENKLRSAQEPRLAKMIAIWLELQDSIERKLFLISQHLLKLPFQDLLFTKGLIKQGFMPGDQRSAIHSLKVTREPI